MQHAKTPPRHLAIAVFLVAAVIAGSTQARADSAPMSGTAESEPSTEDPSWHENPHATRYFFAPSALGLEAGTGYYQNAMLLFHNVNYGVTDRVSVGAGIIPLFLFGLPQVTPAWLLPKVSVPMPGDKIHVAAGAMLGGILAGDSSMSLGVLYGSATVGDRDNNVTVGLGYGYAAGGITERPVINVSGMMRASESIYLVTENYVFPGADRPLLSGGVRWAPENVAVDFSVLSGGTPWMGVSIPFGG